MQYIIIINLVISAIVFVGTSVVFYDKGRKAERAEWQGSQAVFIASIEKVKAESKARIEKQQKKHEEILLTVMSEHNAKTEKLNSDIDKFRHVGLRYKATAHSNCRAGAREAEGTSTLAQENQYELPEGITRRLSEIGKHAEEVQELRNNLIDICGEHLQVYDNDKKQ